MPPRILKTLAVLDQSPGDRAAAFIQAFSTIATTMGLPWQAERRMLDQTTDEQLASATRIVCVCGSELRLTVESRFPNVASRIEYLASTEPMAEAVNTYVAVLLGGGFHASPPPPPAAKAPEVRKRGTVKVGRETAGRRGKGVTVVWDLELSETELQALATQLKQKCGTGGTAKNGRIEIQGDQRDRIAQELESQGFKVKRAGG